MGLYKDIEIKESENQPKEKVLAFKVLNHLIKKERGEATELLVEEFMRNNYVYTIRDDENAEMWCYHEGIYIPEAKTFIKEFCRGILGEVYTTTLANAVIAKIEADTYIDSKDFFENKNVDEVAVLNGILNIHTRKLNKFTPTKIFFNKIPVEYNPKAECPNIINHFNAVLKSEEDLPVIQEVFGYCLLKDYPFAKGVILSGSGRNGKSTSVELIKIFLGAESCSGIPLQDLEENKFAVGELLNKLANIYPDIPKHSLRSASTFKSLTGGDLISADRKFKPRVHFVNYSKLIFGCNDLPITYDTTAAFWNRWILLEFPYTFLKRKEIQNLDNPLPKNIKVADDEIKEKIFNDGELSGLLNWSLDGLKRLIDGGGFSYSSTAKEVEMLWLRKSSSFNAFIMDCLEEDYEGKIAKTELRKAYSMYCREHKLKPVGEKTIKRAISELGVGEDRIMWGDKQVYVWEGIRFNDSYGSYDNYGFSTLVKKVKNDIGKKRVDILATLANEKNTLGKCKECGLKTKLKDDLCEFCRNGEEIKEELIK